MSLRDRLRDLEDDRGYDLYEKFGILSNPFPASHQTTGNPRHTDAKDIDAEDRVVEFFHDNTSQVVVIEGTQGVGKTNFLSNFENEVSAALRDRDGYYVVRYLVDPEENFDGTTRCLIEELGKGHLDDLVGRLKKKQRYIGHARSHDMRTALRSIVKSNDQETKQLMMEWLMGLRLLKLHREALGVQFRLDTVESRTAALKDLAKVSGEAGVLKGIFLLLDEIEKHGDGALGIRAVMRYLQSLRAMIDALPRRLFLMIAVTPDALRRYSEFYPALRSRLQYRLELKSLTSAKAARKLAKFYLDEAREDAGKKIGDIDDRPHILSSEEVDDCFEALEELAKKSGSEGVAQRDFLHQLHQQAEAKLK